MTLRVKSLKAALDEFLRAPSADEGRTNEGHVEHVLGHYSVKDRATFDAVSEKYGKRVDNFTDAFKLAWHGRRDWRDFDIEVLRDSFPDLLLPPRVEKAILDEEEAEARKRAYEESAVSEEESYIEPALDEPEYPPVELSSRPDDYDYDAEREEPVFEAEAVPPLELKYRKEKPIRGSRTANIGVKRFHAKKPIKKARPKKAREEKPKKATVHKLGKTRGKRTKTVCFEIPT